MLHSEKTRGEECRQWSTGFFFSKQRAHQMPAGTRSNSLTRQGIVRKSSRQTGYYLTAPVCALKHNRKASDRRAFEPNMARQQNRKHNRDEGGGGSWHSLKTENKNRSGEMDTAEERNIKTRKGETNRMLKAQIQKLAAVSQNKRRLRK